jgi:hypothetical protein
MVEVATVRLAGAAVLPALIARAFSRMLVRPILDMASAADAMHGRVGAADAGVAPDEIGVLGWSLATAQEHEGGDGPHRERRLTTLAASVNG